MEYRKSGQQRRQGLDALPRRDDVRRGRREVVHAQGRRPTRRPRTRSSIARSSGHQLHRHRRRLRPGRPVASACSASWLRSAKRARRDRARDEVPLHDGRRAERAAAPRATGSCVRSRTACAGSRPIASTSTRSTCRTSTVARGRDAARARRPRARRQGALHRLLSNYAAYRLMDSLWRRDTARSSASSRCRRSTASSCATSSASTCRCAAKSGSASCRGRRSPAAS